MALVSWAALVIIISYFYIFILYYFKKLAVSVHYPDLWRSFSVSFFTPCLFFSLCIFVYACSTNALVNEE